MHAQLYGGLYLPIKSLNNLSLDSNEMTVSREQPEQPDC